MFDFANYNRFQNNLANGQPNDWQCRAGARYLYVCEDGLVHWCSQQRGHPGIPLEQLHRRRTCEASITPSRGVRRFAPSAASIAWRRWTSCARIRNERWRGGSRRRFRASRLVSRCRENPEVGAFTIPDASSFGGPRRACPAARGGAEIDTPVKGVILRAGAPTLDAGMARTRVAILTWLAGVLLVVSLTSLSIPPRRTLLLSRRPTLSVTSPRSRGPASRATTMVRGGRSQLPGCHGGEHRRACRDLGKGAAQATRTADAAAWEPAAGSEKEIDAFVAWMEATLDAPEDGSAAGLPRRSRQAKAGYVPVQRLTQTEFGAAVNNLLGIELDAEALLPAEIEECHGWITSLRR